MRLSTGMAKSSKRRLGATICRYFGTAQQGSMVGAVDGVANIVQMSDRGMTGSKYRMTGQIRKCDAVQ